MKNIKYILLGLFAAATIVACDPTEAGPLLDFAGESSVLLALNNPNTAENLPVAPDQSTTFEIIVGVTNRSNVDRTVALSFDSTESTVDLTKFQVPSIVIPAGQYEGRGNLIALQDNAFVPGRLKLDLDGISDTSGVKIEELAVSSITFFTFAFCPFPNNQTFAGNYSVQMTSLNAFGEFTFEDGNGGPDMISLSEGANASIRSFDTNYGPGIAAFPVRTYSFSLICGEVIWNGNQPTGLGCAGSIINLGEPDAFPGNGTYTEGDDTTFTVNFTDDITNSCGARLQVSAIFTRIP